MPHEGENKQVHAEGQGGEEVVQLRKRKRRQMTSKNRNISLRISVLAAQL
jgi:hypothetical protein